jgi:hypothetical protein
MTSTAGHDYEYIRLALTSSHLCPCSISAKNLNNIDITMEWLVKHAKNPSS